MLPVSGDMLHGVWYVTDTGERPVQDSGQYWRQQRQTALFAVRSLSTRAYNQLKFTDCSRHEYTQARWVLVASTMVVLHEPDHAGAAEPRNPGVSWSPLFVSYSDFDTNFSLTSAVSGTMQCDLRFHKSDEKGLR